MSQIPDSFIDDILERIDIIDLIDSRVKLKRSGKNYMACCPFHDEKTPSFTVHPDNQFYYCFGCGATGDAISFIREYERLDFVDAVENIAGILGIEVPRETSPQQDRFEKQRRALYRVLESAASFYEDQLKQHPQRDQAVRYLKGRGLSGQVARAFGMGFAPPGWDNAKKYLLEHGYDTQDLIDSGLLIAKDNDRAYDRFRHRITFPIRDSRGRVIGFGGRVLGDDKPKYLNSPETPVFSKSKELYGLYQARQKNAKLDKLLVVEGYMDVIALAQYEIDNAVATLGTACGEQHLTLAFKYCNEVVFCFDGDNAGRNAAKRALLSSLTAMEDGRQIKFLFLPEGHDPDTLVRQIGKDRFLAQAKNAVPLEEFLFDVAADNIDLGSLEGRARFSKNAAPLVEQIPKGIYRELMFENLAKRTGLSRQVVEEQTRAESEVLQQIRKPVVHAAEKPPLSPSPGSHSAPENEAGESYHSAAFQEREPSHAAYDGQFDEAPPYTDGDIRSGLNTDLELLIERGAIKRSSITFNPVRTATVHLLNYPSLLNSLDTNIEEIESDDLELQRLQSLISYIRKRPDCSFNNIIGFWGGAYGVDAQQELVELVANNLLSDNPESKGYDHKRELSDALSKIESQNRQAMLRNELALLQSKGLHKLDTDEKNRYRELILQRAVPISSEDHSVH